MTDNRQIELDGWGNLLTGMGETNSENATSFSRSTTPLLPTTTLANIFAYDGLANIVCTEIPGDGLKNWVHIDGDSDRLIQDKLRALKAKTEFFNAWASTRAMGGALLVVDLDDDETKLDTPVDVTKIKSVRSLELYDRSRLTLTPANFETDVNSPGFGKIKTYTVTRADGSQVPIHESRCLYFAGEYLPHDEKVNNSYFDGSVIQRVYSSLSKIAPAFAYANRLLERFNVLKFGIKGLSEKLANGQESQILTRLRIMKKSMSIMNAALFDPEGEEIVSETINVTGLPDLLKQFMVLFSAESRIPVSRLFTKIVGGIGSEGDSDEARYYDYVKRESERVLTEPFDRLISYIASSSDVAIDPDEIHWEFAPIQQTSQKEKSDIFAKNVESLAKLVEWNLITTGEARAALMNEGGALDLDLDESPEQDDEEGA